MRIQVRRDKNRVAFEMPRVCVCMINSFRVHVVVCSSLINVNEYDKSIA